MGGRAVSKIVLILLLVSTNAFAFPEAPFNALKKDINLNFSQKSLVTFDFEGIVKLSNCSGSLIRFNGQPDTSNAYVLTNGHCLGRPFLKPGQARINVPSDRKMKIADSKMNFIDVTAKRLVYGTMTGTDVAIYELYESYEDISQFGIEPFELDTQRPFVGMDIEVISGYWERGYSCHIDAFVFELRESDWTFKDSIRYSKTGCKVIGGTSGSPVIQKNTRTVVGVNNTGNDDGRQCSMNNPCEVDENGRIRVFHKRGYGQQTYQFYSCLTPDFQIDVNLPACELTK